MPRGSGVVDHKGGCQIMTLLASRSGAYIFLTTVDLEAIYSYNIIFFNMK